MKKVSPIKQCSMVKDSRNYSSCSYSIYCYVKSNGLSLLSPSYFSLCPSVTCSLSLLFRTYIYLQVFIFLQAFLPLQACQRLYIHKLINSHKLTYSHILTHSSWFSACYQNNKLYTGTSIGTPVATFTTTAECEISCQQTANCLFWDKTLWNVFAVTYGIIKCSKILMIAFSNLKIYTRQKLSL